MDFLQRCARTAGLRLDDPGIAVDTRGLQNLVLIDRDRGVVWRFPRTAGGCLMLQDAARRLILLAGHGLPVPLVLDCRPASGPGDGYLMLSYRPGAALDAVDTDALGPPERRRLIDTLIEVVQHVHGIPVEHWPTPRPAWAGIWQALAADVANCRGLPDPLAEHQLALAQHAALVAAQAPIGIFHGDLGGVNCRIDPSTGQVLGLLDWDSASVGDTATDIAAILAGLGRVTAEEMRARSERWRAEEERYRAYVDTWPIQYHLWALRSGDPLDRRASLDLLSAPAAAGPR